MLRRLTLLAIALLVPASCGAPTTARRAALPAGAVAAVRGAPLTLAIDRVVPAGAVAATYGGEPVPARVYTVEPAPQTAPSRAWRRPGPRWRTPALPTPASLTLAAVALPADAASGQTLVVAGERRAVEILRLPPKRRSGKHDERQKQKSCQKRKRCIAIKEKYGCGHSQDIRDKL